MKSRTKKTKAEPAKRGAGRPMDPIDTSTPAIAQAYAEEHERAVRLAYAIAGWAEDYPCGDAPTRGHVARLRDVVRDLSRVLERLGVPEPPATRPGEGF